MPGHQCPDTNARLQSIISCRIAAGNFASVKFRVFRGQFILSLILCASAPPRENSDFPNNQCSCLSLLFSCSSRVILLP